MRNLLHRFAVAYRMEVWLLCRHWSYALLHALWTALLLYIVGWDRDAGSARALLEDDFGRFVTSLLSLTAFFVAGASATRGQRTRFAAIDVALPTGTEIVLGRWLALTTALLMFLVQPLIIAALRGPFDAFVTGATIFVAETLIAVVFSATFAVWLMDWVAGRGRWVYLLLAGIWLGCNYGPEFLMAVTQNAAIELVRFGRTHTRLYSEMFGRIADGSLPWWFNAFYAALIVVFLALIIARTQVQRFHRRPVMASLAGIVALGLTLFCGSQYVGEMQVRTAHIAADVSGDPLSMPPSAEQITAYDLRVDLREPATPRIDATLAIRNTGTQPLDQITLTLHHDLRVEDANLPFERRGDALIITPEQPLAPNATANVQLHYGGALWRFWARYDAVPEPIFFTHRKGVRLATGAGWYPLAGRIPLTLSFGISAGDYIHAPAEFRLTVDGPPHFTFASNLRQFDQHTFAAPDATWMFLVGGPNVVTQQTGDVLLITARDEVPTLRPTIDVYNRSMQVLRRFFPGVTMERAVVAVMDGAGLPTWERTPPVAGQPIVVGNRSDLGTVVRSADSGMSSMRLPVIMLLPDVWRIGGGATERYLPDGVVIVPEAYGAASAVVQAYMEVQGDPQHFRQVLEREAGTGEKNLPYNLPPSLAALATVYEQQGEDGLARVLMQMLVNAAELDRLDAAQLQAWIQEAVDEH